MECALIQNWPSPSWTTFGCLLALAGCAQPVGADPASVPEPQSKAEVSEGNQTGEVREVNFDGVPERFPASGRLLDESTQPNWRMRVLWEGVGPAQRRELGVFGGHGGEPGVLGGKVRLGWTVRLRNVECSTLDSSVFHSFSGSGKCYGLLLRSQTSGDDPEIHDRVAFWDDQGHYVIDDAWRQAWIDLGETDADPWSATTVLFAGMMRVLHSLQRDEPTYQQIDDNAVVAFVRQAPEFWGEFIAQLTRLAGPDGSVKTGPCADLETDIRADFRELQREPLRVCLLPDLS